MIRRALDGNLNVFGKDKMMEGWKYSSVGSFQAKQFGAFSKKGLPLVMANLLLAGRSLEVTTLTS